MARGCCQGISDAWRFEIAVLVFDIRSRCSAQDMTPRIMSEKEIL